MNAAERQVIRIAIVLFVVGALVRVLPYGLPSVDSVEIPSRLEYESPPPVDSAIVQDKVRKTERSPAPKKVRPKKASVKLPLHINTATEAELCALKGVGPKLASKIVLYREAHGPFKNPKNLKKVPGIGDKKLEGMLKDIIFD